MTLSSLKRRSQNAPRPAWKAAEAFKKWVRGWECACEGRNPDCGGKIEAAHVDYAGKGTRDAKGTATKVADKFTIPLSSRCHRLQTDKGWPWFEVSILGAAGAAEKLARELWQKWPQRLKWERANG